MADDPAKDPEKKPQLPPSKMREAVDKRGKTSGATIARRQGQQAAGKKGGKK